MVVANFATSIVCPMRRSQVFSSVAFGMTASPRIQADAASNLKASRVRPARDRRDRRTRPCHQPPHRHAPRPLDQPQRPHLGPKQQQGPNRNHRRWQGSSLVHGVEPRAHVSNSSPCSITCFWQPCQQRLSPRQTAFRLVHEENHEDRCKRAQIKPKAVDLGTPRMEPTRGGAAADLA